MSEEKIIDVTVNNEETVNEEVAEENLSEEITLTRKDIDNIMDSLENHKMHIEDLYEKVNQKQALINLGNVDAVGVTKWIAILGIGLALSKNGGNFGIDIPFFHIRIGSDK